MSVYMSVYMCRYAIERSRQTVNLLPQGKHLGASPSRHTKLWGFGLTGKTLRHLETTVRFCQIPLRNYFLIYFEYIFDMVVEVTTTVLDSRFRSIRMKIYIRYIQDLNIGFSSCDRKIFNGVVV